MVGTSFVQKYGIFGQRKVIDNLSWYKLHSRFAPFTFRPMCKRYIFTSLNFRSPVCRKLKVVQDCWEYGCKNIRISSVYFLLFKLHIRADKPSVKLQLINSITGFEIDDFVYFDPLHSHLSQCSYSSTVQSEEAIPWMYGLQSVCLVLFLLHIHTR